MKTRKHILLYGIACIILTIVILSVIVIAADVNLVSNDAPVVDSHPTPELEVANNKKTFCDIDGKIIPLTFFKTDNVGIFKDSSVYRDSGGNEYFYDLDGNFFGIIFMSYSPNYKNETVISEGKALEIGRDFAQKLFGKEFEKLTDNTIVTRAPSSDMYILRFDKAYGVDNFILGACCSMTIDFDGSVGGCAMSRGTVPDDFDEDLVKDLTKEKVLANVVSQAEKAFGKVTEFNDQMITLEKVDGKYVIKIDGWFVTPDKPSADAQEFCKANGLIFTSHDVDFEKRVTNSYSVEGSFYYALEP